MNTSRLIVVIGAGLGMLGCFLPWAHVGIFSVSGYQGPDGWIAMGLFAIPLAVALLGKHAKPMSGIKFVALVTGLSGGALGVVKIATIPSPMASPGIGLFAMVIGGVLVLVGVFKPSKSTNEDTAADMESL